MTDLWQVSFTTDENPEILVEILMAALDAETVTIHQDDLDEPWQTALILPYQPDQDQVHFAADQASIATGQQKPEITISKLPKKDWLLENRKSFPALSISSFWVYGSHISDPIPNGMIGLKINAGLAFGSGSHATTHGCVVMLEKHCPAQAELAIADIGCGSGILAMAAAKIRPSSHVIAVDNDILAVETTAENCIHNSVDTIVKIGLSDGYKDTLVQSNAPYDVVLANILPSPLIDMAQDAEQVLDQDGVLILSGLMVKHKDDVVAAYQKIGLSLIDDMTVDGWMTLVMKKSS